GRSASGARPSGQGSLFAAADHGPRCRRSGVGPPCPARRGRRPRSDARGRRRSAFGSAGDHRRHPSRRRIPVHRLRPQRWCGPARTVLRSRRRAQGGRLAGRDDQHGAVWGADYEAVSIQAGWPAARHVIGADSAVVAQGPGNLGTGTKYGYSGLVTGEHLNAAALLGGRPVGALRMSNADARGRHFGISHHSLTPLTEIARPGVIVPVPDFATLTASERSQMDPDPGVVEETVAGQLETLGMHRLVNVDLTGLWAALRSSPVGLSTMGRKLRSDA